MKNSGVTIRSKKKLLYFSPMPPLKSGIADYSDTLVNYLAEEFEVTLVVDQIQVINLSLYNMGQRDIYKSVNPGLFNKFAFFIYGLEPVPFSEYDFIIYNIGNNPWYHNYMYQAALENPGLIILHDHILFYLTVGHYQDRPKLFWRKMRELGGWNAIKLFIDMALNGENFLTCPYTRVLPLNKEILNSKNKIMVHSRYSEKKIKEEVPQRLGLYVVPHVDLKADDGVSASTMRSKVLKELNLEEDVILLSSFGYIAETKLNHLVCEVVLELSAQFPRLRYLMVGEGDYVDRYVDGKIVMKTGFVQLHDFNKYLLASDLIANLRWPSMGETSGSLIRAMGEGKPCFISNDGWFAEVPDDAAIKIDNSNAKATFRSGLLKLLESPHEKGEIGRKAAEFIKERHSGQAVTKEIVRILNL